MSPLFEICWCNLTLGIALVTTVLGIVALKRLYDQKKFEEKLKESGKDFKVAIIGGGFGGICMAIQLKKIGFNNFVLYEKAAGVGGAWHYNKYPGLTCDWPSLSYSFSFESNNYPWSRRYAPRNEIVTYFHHLVAKYGLHTHIKLSHKVIAAEYDNDNKKWKLTIEKHLEGGIMIENNSSDKPLTIDTIRDECNMVVAGTGQLNTPHIPDFQGMKLFRDNGGSIFHSSGWDDEFVYENKNIGLIGTGASAMQLGPELSKTVSKLYVFQRSIAHLFPKNDYTTSRLYNFLIQFRIFSIISMFRRWKLYWTYELKYPPIIKNKNYKQNKKVAKQLQEILLDPVISPRDDIEKYQRLRILNTPQFPLFCKRPVVSDTWYPMLLRENVELIDSTIVKFSKNGIIVSDNGYGDREQEIKLDGVFLATGYKSTNFLSSINTIIGKNGIDLKKQWNNYQDVEAYYGIMINNFPNFFMLYGPNTNLGHNSVIFQIECQVNYVIKWIKYMILNDKKCVEVQKDVQDKHNKKLQMELSQTVFSSDKCTSWYKNKRSKKIINNWPHSSYRYWWETCNINVNDCDVA